jgi:hypothetical protein
VPSFSTILPSAESFCSHGSMALYCAELNKVKALTNLNDIITEYLLHIHTSHLSFNTPLCFFLVLSRTKAGQRSD